MHPRTQTTRTNHLGYDVGASRKIPDGALARVATAECRKAPFSVSVFTAAVWCVPALRVPLVHSLIRVLGLNNFRPA